jgi:cytochrome c
MGDAVRRWATAGVLAALVFNACACARGGTVEHALYGLGHQAAADDIARADIDVAPDGSGLPPGRGEAVDGQPIFSAKCLRCHGSFIKLDPERWAYATSIFDYVRRAMPPDTKTPLTSDEIYAITAYLLYANGEIGPHVIVEKASLTQIRMPLVKDFITTR